MSFINIKMKTKKDNIFDEIFKIDNIIPLLIVILCILGIYFIIFKKKKDNYSEFFENFDNQNSDTSTTTISNYENNVPFTINYANGYWTTNNSEFDSNNTLTKLIQISITGDSSTNFSGKIINEDGFEYDNIIAISNLNIIANNKSNPDKSISIIFKNIFKQSEDIDPDLIKIPQCTFYFNENNILVNKFDSYRIDNPSNVGGKLSRIISSKHIYDYDVKPQYNFNLYNKIINNWIFGPDLVTAKSYTNSSSLTTIDKNLLLNKYSNKLYISIRRSFISPNPDNNGQYIKTKISKPYVINIMSGTSYLNDIIIKNLNYDLQNNNVDINDMFRYKSCEIYLYKWKDNLGSNYTFDNDYMLNKNKIITTGGTSKLNLFSTTNVDVPDVLQSVLNNNNDYELILINTQTYLDSSSMEDISKLDITLSLSSFKNYL